MQRRLISSSAREAESFWYSLWGWRHWQELFLCFSSAFLVPVLVDAILTPPPSLLAPVGAPCSCTLQPQLTMPQPVGRHKPQGGCSLRTWFWWPKGIAFLGPMGLKQSERQSLASYYPMALHRQQTKTHLQSSCGKGLYSCPGVSAWGAGFTFATHAEVAEAPPRNMGWKKPYLHSPLALPQFVDTSLKGGYAHV